MEASAEWGIAANVISDHALRTNTKVYVSHCNGDAENPFVIGHSKDGRVIRKFTKYKRLANFRPVWIPENFREVIRWKYNSKEEAQTKAEGLNG